MQKSNVAVVTGAGSGMGQAIALALAQQGWQVAILGRRAAALRETIARASAHAGQLHPFACDVGDEAAVAAMGRQVREQLGPVEVLVNAAGTNAPRRSLAELSSADYHLMLNTNLNGAYYCVQAFLPEMRARGSGTIVNVISDAAKQASPKAGPAYSMSKAGMLGLTQAINAEERAHGVRACALLPGDTDTPLLDRRPAPPDAAARARMLQPSDVAECALLAINLPARAVVEEILVRPR